jgi:hypothetical protein
MMDKKSQAEFDRITALEPAALTDNDRAFLKARRSYLKPEKQVEYGVTGEEPEPEEESTNSESKPSKSKKGSGKDE